MSNALPKKPCANALCPALVTVGTVYCPACSRTRPKAPCRAPGCGALVAYPDRYCPKHVRHREQQRDKRRGSSSARGYTYHWQKVRKVKLMSNPLCEECERDGFIRLASQVHHIDHNARNNAAANLMSVCVPCHTKLGKHGAPKL